jgi:hypothetical protein
MYIMKKVSTKEFAVLAGKNDQSVRNWCKDLLFFRRLLPEMKTTEELESEIETILGRLGPLFGDVEKIGRDYVITVK